jgi:uncharacterized protein
MMVIKIAGLSEGIHNYEFIEQVEKVDLGSPFSGKITAEIELDKSHHEIVMNVNVRVNAEFECDRCTASFTRELNPVYKMVYIYGSGDDLDDDANMKYIHPDADKIDISPEVRDFTLLSVPMKKLCSDECKGLCSNCGTDLNKSECSCELDSIDSRWLPLQDLKKKLNNN